MFGTIDDTGPELSHSAYIYIYIVCSLAALLPAMTLRMVKSAHQAGFFRKNHAYGGGQKHQHSDSGSSAGVLLVGRRTNFAVDKVRLAPCAAHLCTRNGTAN
jgi:hypothetical protein